MLYEYECPNGHKVEEIRRVADRRAPIECRVCERKMELQISVNATPVLNPSNPVRPGRVRGM